MILKDSLYNYKLYKKFFKIFIFCVFLEQFLDSTLKTLRLRPCIFFSLSNLQIRTTCPKQWKGCTFRNSNPGRGKTFFRTAESPPRLWILSSTGVVSRGLSWPRPDAVHSPPPRFKVNSFYSTYISLRCWQGQLCSFCLHIPVKTVLLWRLLQVATGWRCWGHSVSLLRVSREVHEYCVGEMHNLL